jgi:hypothetical protein
MRLKVEDIINGVCTTLELDKDKVLSGSRKHKYVRARYVIIFFALEMIPRLSLRDLGVELDLDRSSVHAGLKKHYKLTENPDYLDMLGACGMYFGYDSRTPFDSKQADIIKMLQEENKMLNSKLDEIDKHMESMAESFGLAVLTIGDRSGS